ncbi:hypothetical protein SFRURICE_006102 [Spodoptera frugiperda]|nr:hypothetical protein SFRURICE_006102 [Spodoptera frugiperda]
MGNMKTGNVKRKLAKQTLTAEERRKNVQMVGLFMVIVVVCRLRAGAPQPPDGVAGRHQHRQSESVTSHTRERYDAHYHPAINKSRAETDRVPTQCSPYDQDRREQGNGQDKHNQQVTG